MFSFTVRDDPLGSEPPQAQTPGNEPLAPSPTPFPDSAPNQPKRQQTTILKEALRSAGRGAAQTRGRGVRAGPRPPALPAPPQLHGTQHSPSGRCPARSRRTPHSWRGRRGRKPRERRKRRLLGTRELDGHPDNAGGALRPVSGPEGKGKSGGEVRRSWTAERPAATSDGKRRAGPRREGGRKGERQAEGGLGLRGWGGAKRRRSEGCPSRPSAL